MKTIIYHNQNCSKSCAVMDTLKEMDVQFDVVEYLKTPPSAAELREIVAMLGIRPEALVRKNEAVYREKFEGKNLTDEAWIEAMAEFPVLIERPVVVHCNKAAIGRPVEKVVTLINPIL